MHVGKGPKEEPTHDGMAFFFLCVCVFLLSNPVMEVSNVFSRTLPSFHPLEYPRMPNILAGIGPF